MLTGSPSDGMPSVSVVIPVRDDAARLDQCLGALGGSVVSPVEVIVVDDGSTDDSGDVARRHGARLLRLDRSHGPAHARNRGAELAAGDVLFFVDADVVVFEETVGTAARVLSDRRLAAVIGSYDDQPGHPSFISQYKNLFHHWVHQTSREEAWTFWTGCGAIRRDVFLEMGGFNEGYPKPSIEDIELGFRLRAQGHHIRLEKTMLARHTKEWRLFDLIRTDVFQRGVPWIALMLRDRFAVSDLNISSESRHSTVLCYLTLLALVATPFWPSVLFPWSLLFAALAWGTVVWMHRGFYRFFVEKRGRLFALRVMPMHFLFFIYSGLCVPFGVMAHHLDRRRAARKKTGPGVRELAPLSVDTEGVRS